MNKGIICILIFAGCGLSTSLLSQGCSDAGACSIPAMTPSANVMVPEKKNQLNIGITAGVGDYDIFILTPSVGYSRTIGSGFSVDGNLTYSMHSGNEISKSGLGDLFLNLNYAPSSAVILTGGMKIPISDVNKLYEGKSLPLDYQPTLGTLDLIMGVAYQPADWHLGLAVQIPISQNNNLFNPEDWPESSPLREIPGQFQFNRKGDLVLRISKEISMSDRVTLIPGLLPIFHLGLDQTRNDDNVFEDIEGSDGLTLNATLHVNVKLRETSALHFNIGFPFIVRDVRPDGLTRSVVAGAEYSVWF